AEWSWVLRGLSHFDFGLVLGWAVFGAVLASREWRRLRWLYGMVAAYALSVVVCYVLARYRVPVVPVLLLVGKGAGAMGGRLRRSSEWGHCLCGWVARGKRSRIIERRLRAGRSTRRRGTTWGLRWRRRVVRRRQSASIARRCGCGRTTRMRMRRWRRHWRRWVG